jgi:hypothetical protein
VLKEKIDSKIFAANFERVLAADEREADAEFQQEFSKVLRRPDSNSFSWASFEIVRKSKL